MFYCLKRIFECLALNEEGSSLRLIQSNMLVSKVKVTRFLYKSAPILWSTILCRRALLLLLLSLLLSPHTVTVLTRTRSCRTFLLLAQAIVSFRLNTEVVYLVREILSLNFSEKL